jgi:Zn-dependent peptidase ImmA (M78 family)
MKPFLRFLLAREIGRHVLIGNTYLPEQTPIIDVRLNIFATALLMPAPLLQTALRHADPSCNLVDQLATLFWLPRSIVASQLRDFIVQ